MTAVSLVDCPYAWRRLAASVALSTLGGIGMWCLAVALPAVQADLGVSRADISFAYSMNMIGFFVGGIAVGRLVDRHGIVFTSIVSALGLAAGFALAPATSSLGLFAAAQVLIGFSAVGDLCAVDRRHLALVRARRGIAVGIAASGNYIAGAVWPPIVELMIHDHGWRITYWSAAALCLVTMIPLAVTLRRRAPDHEEAACRRRGPSLAGDARPVAQRPAGAADAGRPLLLRRHVDAAGPYRRLLRRPGLRRGARRRRCCR